MIARVRRIVLRLLVTALVLVAALWVTVRIYVAHETHRALALLEDARQVRIGDSEVSVLPLVERYNGHQFMPYKVADLDRNNFADLWVYEYRRRNAPDHAYRLGIIPWALGTDPMMDTDHRVRLARWLAGYLYTAPATLRRLLGTSFGEAYTQISVRNGRVSAVYTSVSGERHSTEESIWHGSSPKHLLASWEVADEMPCQDRQGVSYAAEASLSAENGGWYISNYLTPNASEEQFQVAQSWNMACMTSFGGCEGVNQLAPNAIEYLKKHPQTVTASTCP